MRRDYSRRGNISAGTKVARAIHACACKAKPLSDAGAPIMLAEMIPWRDTLWWKTVQHMGMEEDSTNTMNWKDGAYFRSHGNPWDLVLFKTLGETWRSAISSTTLCRDEFVAMAFREVGVKCPGICMLAEPCQDSVPCRGAAQ